MRDGDGAATATAVLAAAGAAAGVDVAGAVVVRAGASTVFRLPGTGWLARVTAGPGEDAARREVAVAALLASVGVPAVRLAPVGRQPLSGPGGVVTVWEDARPLPGEPPSGELGRLARHLHEATAAAPALDHLPPVDPPAAAADRLHQAGAAGSLAPGDAAVLWDAHARLAPAWAARRRPVRPALVHGDLHPANVLVTADGPVLADLELSGVGDPAYDLAPALVAVRRYGRPPSHQDEFAAAYGADVRDDPDVDLLCEVYELWVTAWSVAAAAAGPELAAEAALRIATWRGEAPSRPWTLY